jgi:gluconate 2-dehydrogenase gamma chain
MRRNWSRREMLRRAAALGAVTAIPGPVFAQGPLGNGIPYANLSSAEAVTLEAFVARLVPSDASGPGALEAGAARYIDRTLGEALATSRSAYAAGLAALQAYAQRTAGRPFSELAPDQQDAVLRDLEQNRATGFAPDAATFFDLVLGHTLEGTFGDPHYGGNRNFIGWELLSYPGIRLAVAQQEQRMNAELEPTRISAYDLPMFDTDSSGERDDD